jgi:hypothetical protein
MASRLTPLGDPHNFGRHVSLQGKRVLKPRALLWEWLLLSSQSPLRRLLADLAADGELPPDWFEFLPSLRFFTPVAAARGAVFGEVEKLELKPLARLGAAGRAELASITGRALALFSWLGLSDLHWENLVLGRDRRDHIVFGPLDVEMILAELSLPTETKLLPDPDPEYAAICQHACGVRRVLPYLGKPVAPPDLLAIAGGYLRTLALLDRNTHVITKLIAGAPGMRETPIRVCLRGTDEYVRAYTAPLWPPLLAAEHEQLARGDIPYFFRYYGRRGIHYYAEPTLASVKRLPLRGDVPQLDPMLSLARGMRTPARRMLRQEGLLALIGAFDHPSISGQHTNQALSVTFGRRRLLVQLPSGETLRSPRDLSGLVNSVYQPCRCGEVRSVFVPPVTKCERNRRAV